MDAKLDIYIGRRYIYGRPKERAMSPIPGSGVQLTPAMHVILLSLLAGDRHGYAIMQAVEELTGGDTRLGPGTLYSSIKKMIDTGLIEETGDRPDPALDDDRRRYYRISGSGRQAVRSEAQRLERLVRYTSNHIRAV